jgi:trehalose/maltose hydrolase-like predicted phosphorylase
MKLLLFLTFIPFLAHASNEISQCGEYRIKGVVKPKDNTAALIVNENTFSEHTIKFKLEELVKVALFMDNHVNAKIEILHPFKGYYGVADKVLSIDMNLADPLEQNPERITRLQIKISACF